MNESIRDVIYTLVEGLQKGDAVEIVGGVLAGCEGVFVTATDGGKGASVKITKVTGNIAKQYTKVGKLELVKQVHLTKLKK
jgi:transcription antitermination factor NusG